MWERWARHQSSFQSSALNQIQLKMALSLPLFHGQYRKEVRLEADLGYRSYGEVGGGSLRAE